jgi:hypothetical protein
VHGSLTRIGNPLSKTPYFYYRFMKYYFKLLYTRHYRQTSHVNSFWFFHAVFMEPSSTFAKTLNPVFISSVIAIVAVTYTAVICTAVEATRGEGYKHFIRGYGWRPHLLSVPPSCLFFLGFSRKSAVVTVVDPSLLFPFWAKESLEDLAIGIGGGVEYLHRCPASRRRHWKGNPVPGGITWPPCSWGI